jgi:hypothetical protein
MHGMHGAQGVDSYAHSTFTPRFPQLAVLAANHSSALARPGGMTVKQLRSALACVLLSVAPATACTHHDGNSGEQKAQTGTLSMALETTAASGNRYRLRQAVFLVDRDQGSPDFPDGDGGISPGGDGDFSVGDAGFGMPTPAPAPAPGRGGQDFVRFMSIDSDDNPLAPDIKKELPEDDYRVFLTNGWFVEKVVGNRALPVNATLRGSATKFVSIFSNQNSSLSFEFETNGEIIDFQPGGTLTIKPVIIEDGGVDRPDGGDGDGDGDVDVSNVIETQRSALDFSLREVLGTVAQNGGFTSDPELLYQSIIDSYASKGKGRLESAVHCGDETTDGVPTLNGYRIDCDRPEAQQFNNLDSWFPLAAVSRLDLAPLDGSHCGQQRLVFANNEPIGNSRMFMILEAQIPNPHPECGVAACQPIAQAWENLRLFAGDPVDRAGFIREMFLTGSPDLQNAGFAPFAAAANYTVGSGQIRTNNFDGDFWTLREFKVVTDSASLMAIPFPTAESPNGELWNDTLPLPQGEACRQNFLSALNGLLTDNVARMAFVVDDACKDSESRNDFSEFYPDRLSEGSGAFAKQIDSLVADFGLTSNDIAARAEFAGSCIGCHSESNGNALGNMASAPFSNDFTHLSEQFFERCSDGSRNCTGMSQALHDVFLPHRRDVQQALLETGGCGGPSQDAGVGSSSDGGIEPPTDRDAGPALPPGDGDGIIDDGAPTPAKPRTITVPVMTSSVKVSDLVRADDTARDAYEGQQNLGGQPARVTH